MVGEEVELDTSWTLVFVRGLVAMARMVDFKSEWQLLLDFPWGVI